MTHLAGLFFLYFCIWLLTNLEGDSERRLQDEHAHTIQGDTAGKSTSLPFLWFAIEYIALFPIVILYDNKL